LVAEQARTQLEPVRRIFENGAGHSSKPDLEELSRRTTESLFEVGLPSDMLRKVDMMGMLAGIEVRVPLLDERIVEFGLTLPHRLKTDGQRAKLVLRALADRCLPPSVANHPKHGFSIPLDILVTDSFFDMIRDFLISGNSETRALVNQNVVHRWLELFNRARS